MANNSQQNLLLTLISAHTDTIDAQKRLMIYMNKHITELEQYCSNLSKELESVKKQNDELKAPVIVAEPTQVALPDESKDNIDL